MFLKLIYIALICIYVLPTNSFNFIFASEIKGYLSTKNRSSEKYNPDLNKSLEDIIKENYQLLTGYDKWPADIKRLHLNSEKGLKIISDNKNFLIPLNLELEIKLHLAIFGSQLGYYSLAESYYLEILNKGKDLYEESDTFLIDALYGLATNHMRSGKYKKGKDALETLLAIQKKYLGEDHPLTIITRNELFTIFRINGPLESAKAILDKNKKVLEKVKVIAL